MTFRDVAVKTWNENILFSALVELTYRCNLDCFFCYNDLSLTGAPLTREEYFRFFEDLRDMQVLNLVLTGGEPLAHPDFFELGCKARELGFLVRLKSNGHALRGRTAQRIQAEIDPFVIEVSLHGASAQTHDRQTRVPGSFDRLLANVGEMLELGLRVKINATLTRWNEQEVDGIFAIADSLGVVLQIDPEVTPRDDGDDSPLQIAASHDGLLRLFRLHAERARSARGGGDSAPAASGHEVGRQDEEMMPVVSSEKHCGAGSSGIAVDPYGNVYPCVQWRRAVGNLHKQSIKEIWRVSEGLKAIRRLTAQAKEMVDGYGSAGAFMSFCPGAAVSRDGNPLSVYSSALKRMEAVQKTRNEGRKTPLPTLR